MYHIFLLVLTVNLDSCLCKGRKANIFLVTWNKHREVMLLFFSSVFSHWLKIESSITKSHHELLGRSENGVTLLLLPFQIPHWSELPLHLCLCSNTGMAGYFQTISMLFFCCRKPLPAAALWLPRQHAWEDSSASWSSLVSPHHRTHWEGHSGSRSSEAQLFIS